MEEVGKTPLKMFKKKLGIESATPYKIPGSPLMKKLGFGTGVAVYLMNGSVNKSKTSSSPWAIKKCLKNRTDETYSQRLAAEADILRSLNHPNIVGFRAYKKSDDERFNLAMEACTVSLGNLLEDRHSDNLGPLEIHKIHKMGFDISKALNYLHTEVLLMHGDMKSFNILIKDDFVVCKLCDFGVSQPITKQGNLNFKKKPSANYVGTDLWNAPEVFEEDAELITTKSEIFSFGMVLYETIALVPPHTLQMSCSSKPPAKFPADPKKALDFDALSDDELSDEEEDELDFMVGTRPLFAEDMKLPESYNDVLEVFHICTDENPENRFDTEKLVEIFKALSSI